MTVNENEIYKVAPSGLELSAHRQGSRTSYTVRFYGGNRGVTRSRVSWDRDTQVHETIYCTAKQPREISG